MPWTTMCVSAVHLGFTMNDLKDMPLQRLSWMMRAYNDAAEPPKKKPRRGTAADMKRILGG